MNARFLQILISFLALVFTSTTNAASPADIVARFFPAALKVDDGQAVSPSKLKSAYTLADLDHNGHQLVVAVYGNGENGAVAVLSPEGEGSVLASVLPRNMPGRLPGVELVDLDRDGRPEIVATFQLLRGGTHAWIYKWMGARLALMGPVVDDASEVFDPLFVDVDGDGALEVISHCSGRTTDDDGNVHISSTDTLLKLSGDVLGPIGTLTYVGGFSRGKATPSVVAETFDGSTTATQHLVLINGTPDGKRRASSAIVTLNGQRIFSENDFKQPVSRLETPVSVLPGENKISVEVRGTQDASITLLIIPK